MASSTAWVARLTVVAVDFLDPASRSIYPLSRRQITRYSRIFPPLPQKILVSAKNDVKHYLATVILMMSVTLQIGLLP